MEMALSQLVHNGTHINGNILDLVLCSENDLISSVRVVNAFSNSDHFVVSGQAKSGSFQFRT